MYIYRGFLTYVPNADRTGLTVIFPRFLDVGQPVQAFWQWDIDFGGNHNETQVFYGVVTSIQHETRCHSVKLANDNDMFYLEASFWGEKIGEIYVTYKSKYGVAGREEAMCLVYRSAADDPIVVPRIYMGRGELGKQGEKETLILVVPVSLENGNPICAFWNSTDVNKHHSLIGNITIKRSKMPGGLEMEWEVQNFSFTGRVKPGMHNMVLNVNSQKGGKGIDVDLTLQPPGHHLQDVLALRHEPKISAISDKTSTVVNNTSEAVATVVLLNSGMSTTDKVFAAAGLLLGAAGVATITAGTGVSAFVAAVSMLVSGAAAAHTFNAPGEPQTRSLFPGDSMTRTSSGGIVLSNNDCEFFFARLDSQSHRLIVSRGCKRDLGNETYKLSDLLSDTAIHEVILDIVIEPMKTISYYRIVKIKGLKPEGESSQSPAQPSVGDFYTSAPAVLLGQNPEPPKFYGQLGQYLENSSPSQLRFRAHSSLSIALFLGVSNVNEYYEILRTPGGRLVVKMKNIHIYKATYDIPIVKYSSTEAGVLQAIEEDPTKWAYSWRKNLTTPSQPIYGYGGHIVWDCTYTTGSSAPSAYFLVGAEVPYTHIFT